LALNTTKDEGPTPKLDSSLVVRLSSFVVHTGGLMVSQIRRFGLPVAAVGVIALAASVVLFLIRGNRVDLWVELLLALGVLGLIGYVLLEPDTVRQILTGRTARYGSNAFIFSVAFIGIVVVLNFLGTRHDRRFDLTASGQFSLAPQTIQILANLEQPVKVTAYMTQSYFDRVQAEDLLKEYQVRGAGHFEYEIIDPEAKPGLARQAGITQDGTLVFTAGARQQNVTSVSEQDFTSAILKVTRDTQKKVYFLTGNGERSPDGTDQTSYSLVKQWLEQDNYQVGTLNLAITDTLPADLTVLVVADPQKPLLPDEKTRLNSYLVKGGRLMVLLNPRSPADDWNELLKPWFVEFATDFVVDPASSFPGDPATPIVARYPFNPIARNLAMTIYPGSRSVEQVGTPPQDSQVTVDALAQTSDQSWGITNLTGQQLRVDPTTDKKGPLNLAMAVESPAILGSEEAKTAKSTKTRLVVFGNADFVADGFVNQVRGTGNADLFVNAVNWLAEEEELISIRPKQPDQRTIQLTGTTANLIAYSTIIFLPLAVILAGAGVWWRRR
jgi:ABC-type uncharacterized transport system involved in gliding motility auxiliary subunit